MSIFAEPKNVGHSQGRPRGASTVAAVSQSDARRARREIQRAKRRRDLKGQPVIKIDVMQVVTDARGNEYQPQTDGDDKVRVRDLIHMAMGDDPPAQQGVMPTQAPADEKRRRWRLQTQVMAPGLEEIELSRGDADYIVERASVLLLTPAFGFLDMVVARAIGVSATNGDSPDDGAPSDAPDAA